MDKPKLATQVDAVLGILGRRTDWINRMNEARVDYVVWFLAIAAAGLSVTVTHSKEVIEASLVADALSVRESKSLLVVAALLFIVSAMFGLGARSRIMNVTDQNINVRKFHEFQSVRVEVGDSVVPAAVSADELLKLVQRGAFLSDSDKQELATLRRQQDALAKSVLSNMAAQVLLSFGGFAVVFVVALL